MSDEKSPEQNTKAALARRKLLQGAAAGLVVGAVAGAGIGALGFPKTVTQVQSVTTRTTSVSVPGLPTSWDHEADVVVIGSGGAGLSAALGAIESGATVTQFNQYAANGVDPDFNRGVFSFDLNTCGDPTRADLKNICLAPIEIPPFYGLEIDPGTIGTSGGPRISSSAQVLDQQGNPIAGLYAAGNDAASPFGAGYPGGGGTIGPATTFGWIAGKTAGSS